MMNKQVRTIKVTDRRGAATPQEMEVLHATDNARSAKSDLAAMLKDTEAKLDKEISATYPNEARVTRLRDAVNNLRQTIARANQR